MKGLITAPPARVTITRSEQGERHVERNGQRVATLIALPHNKRGPMRYNLRLPDGSPLQAQGEAWAGTEADVRARYS